jgi:hypothetical protein
MSEEEIVAMIESMHLPYAYHHYAEGEAPALPYLIYTYPQSIPYAADDGVYVQGSSVQLELYSETRDLSVERRIEHILDDNDLVYRKSEVYIESENLYEIIYEMEVAVMG